MPAPWLKMHAECIFNKASPMNIERYKSDHARIVRLVAELKQLVLADCKAHADAIAQKVVEMSFAIKFHLAIEDQILYPHLKKSTDERVAGTARRFQDEMGPLACDFAAFVRRWNTKYLVGSEPAAMRSEAINILERIRRRMHEENQELYPLAELG
jgi:hemerythrin-like domain-containing protein